MQTDLAIYVHWPWCRRICPYCDFNVRSLRSAAPNNLADAVCTDIALWRNRIGPRRIRSVFFGGGTPSTAPVDCLEQILNAVDTWFGLTYNTEISAEANPNDWQKYSDMAAAGVNRLSIGVQSLNDADLRFLGRDHDTKTARHAVSAACATPASVSLDAIYALPDQTPENWKKTLKQLIACNVQHLSLYQLTVSPDTAFGRRQRRGSLLPMPQETAAYLYEITQYITDNAGLPSYEVSNHARRPASQSRHNLVYWQSGDWLGLGPGAHGRVTMDGKRIATQAHADPNRYICSVGKEASHTETFLDSNEYIIERLMSGLRLRSGIDTPEIIDPSAISDLQRIGLLERHPHRLILTPRGRLLADHVSARLCESFT